MYIFKVVKSPDSLDDEFESAIHCAKDCVTSVLDDESLSIEIDEDSIIVKSINNDVTITFAECKKKIKGCFGDASGKLYPEFIKIEPLENKTA